MQFSTIGFGIVFLKIFVLNFGKYECSLKVLRVFLSRDMCRNSGKMVLKYISAENNLSVTPSYYNYKYLDTM